MKRSRFSRRTKQTPDTEELIRLATQLSLSGSRLEDVFWERRLSTTIDRLLHAQDEAALNAALDHLYGAGGRAYDELADMVENCAESRHHALAGAGAGQDVLLFAAPVAPVRPETPGSGRFDRCRGKMGSDAPKDLSRIRTSFSLPVARVGSSRDGQSNPSGFRHRPAAGGARGGVLRNVLAGGLPPGAETWRNFVGDWHLP